MFTLKMYTVPVSSPENPALHKQATALHFCHMHDWEKQMSLMRFSENSSVREKFCQKLAEGSQPPAKPLIVEDDHATRRGGCTGQRQVRAWCARAWCATVL